MGRIRPPLRWLLGLAFSLLAAAETRAASTHDELEIKAAYALNFLRYTHWPEDDAGLGNTNPRVILVLGERPLRSAIRRIAQEAERLGQAPVQVRWADPDSADEEQLALVARDAHAVFISSTVLDDPSALLSRLAGMPVLTIGDSPRFTTAGGMLGLVQLGTRLAFDANTASIRASGLQVSAKVLRLARSVRDS